MDATQLIAEATRRTGLSDFGDDAFVEPLRRLVASILAESEFTPIGAAAWSEPLVTALSNRLQVEDWYRRHPEIEQQEIAAPVFIVGLPRTGSTALGHMLALDPSTRSLREWEARAPCPPPEKATEHSDPRIARAQEAARALEALAPGIKLAVPRDEIIIDECFTLLQLSFASSAEDGFAHVPSYLAWLRRAEFDAVPAYRYHKRVLKLLQWRCPPGRWQLRSPMHGYAIDALGAVYPDARFVWTHRAPEKVIPSVASLMHFIREKSLVDPHPKELGRALVEGWCLALGRLVAFRARAGEARFFDVAHRDLIEAPAARIADLYRWLGWHFEEGYAASIARWRERNPKGDHRPDPGFFGLDLEEIRSRFAFYTERFGRFC